MSCYRPLDCWRQRGNDPGKPKISFTKHDDLATPLTVPCGQCLGCRLERSRRWAVRIVHESQMHERNSFLTLTYDDEHLPKDRSLCLDDFQRFFKRLRKQSASPLRFFHCGEYGETTQRPHYHCCLFGEDFASDRHLLRTTKRGDRLYTSNRLTKTWGLGHAVIGELSFESAAYVARYCLKKVTGDSAEEHYAGRKPEYVTMSRRPGIGATWFDEFRGDLYPRDECVVDARRSLPPPFYDRLLEKVDPILFDKIKKDRTLAVKDLTWSEEQRSGRLLDREFVKTETIKNTLKRSV